MWQDRDAHRLSVPVLVCVLLLTMLVTSAAEEPGPGGVEELRRLRLLERDRLVAKARVLLDAGELDEAISVRGEILALERSVFGDMHREVAGSLEQIADLEESRGSFGEARKRLEEALRIRTEFHGTGHWRVTDARRALDDLNRRAELTAEERAELTEAATLDRRVLLLWRAGEHEPAIPIAERALALRIRILGEDHPDAARSLNDLVLLCQITGERAKAESHGLRALEIRQKALGLNHPDTATSLINLARLYRSSREYPKAVSFYRLALAALEKARGEDHLDRAGCLNGLATLYHTLGEYAEAETLHERALEIRRKALGEDHPDTATSAYNLALLYRSLGEYAKAVPLLRLALATRGRALGQEHSDYARTLSSLAMLHHSMGEYAEAEPLHRRALEIHRKARGEGHPDYATSLSRLASLYESIGELSRAVPLHQRALRIRIEALGPSHPNTATSANNLALLHQNMGEFEEAEPLYRQALDIVGRTLGKDHPNYAASLNNLASLQQSMGKLNEAEALYRQALTIVEQALGKSHPTYATGLNNFAGLCEVLGEYARAASLHRRALEIRRNALGEEHPGYASGLHDLAALHLATGEPAKAEALCRQALEIRRRLLDATFSVLSERQQFQMSRLFRGTLDFYLSLSLLTEAPPVAVYEPLLSWKGAILARQVRRRVQARDARCAALLADLESTSRRLATLAFTVPDETRRAAWSRQVGLLTERREKLERELSRESAVFREVRAAERRTPAELQRALPDGVVLVDVMEYSRAAPPADGGRGVREAGRHLVAFLVPAEGEIERLELGPAEPVARAVESWRGGIRGRDRSGAGKELRRLIWDPLAKHLGDARTVLVSPDGALNRLPLSALPGRTPGTFLVEEFSVAIVPVPRLLPDLLGAKAPDPARESLLLVGDVDYGGAPGRSDGSLVARRSAAGTSVGGLPVWKRLEATRAEIATIRDSFEMRHEDGIVTILRRESALEERFRKVAGRHRWLHLATHGFFAPPGLRSALTRGNDAPAGPGGSPVTGYHPGILSGLALSGANTPVEVDGDDGILTALEVASLDLRDVEVAVLSACETGLGEVAGGEGVLGLQRAFQVAGVRTTVTSLWKVKDVATQLLMQKFYENVWDRDLPKLRALREAQLWLMREGGQRGVAFTGDSEEAPGPLPPHYWAGFVLSGDWR